MADEKLESREELELLGRRLCGFDKLPEYGNAVDAIKKYAEAVGILYHKDIVEDL